MKYEKPEAEVIVFGVLNIVTASPMGGTQTKPEEDDYDFGGL